MLATATLSEPFRQKSKVSPSDVLRVIERRATVRCECGHAWMFHVDGTACLLCREAADLAKGSPASASEYCCEYVPAADRRKVERS
jgi:hypothetical protein